MSRKTIDGEASDLMGFSYRFVPARKGSKMTLLLLHGTGGNEDDLIPLGRELVPEASLLGVRGKVMESGMPRFFRRFAEGVFDLEDLEFRTAELADFVEQASGRYGFDLASVIAIGYSNGANIAASVLLLRPEVLSGAVLFRPMVPFVPKRLPDLRGKSIFLSAGDLDSIVPRPQTNELDRLFREAGADVITNWEGADHSLTKDELAKAKIFLQRRSGKDGHR